MLSNKSINSDNRGINASERHRPIRLSPIATLIIESGRFSKALGPSKALYIVIRPKAIKITNRLLKKEVKYELSGAPTT